MINHVKRSNLKPLVSLEKGPLGLKLRPSRKGYCLADAGVLEFGIGACGPKT